MPPSEAGVAPPRMPACSNAPAWRQPGSPVFASSAKSWLSAVITSTRPPVTAGAVRIGAVTACRHSSAPVAASIASTMPLLPVT